MAIGKFVAGEAGLNPADYADMNAVAASATAMNAVAASATAMNAVAASATAMNAVAASATAVNAVAASATALVAICKSATAAVAVKSAIQNYRSQVVSTLNAAVGTKFSKSSVSVGTNIAGTFDSGLNTNTIYIPVLITDDGGTDTYDIYYGADTTYKIGSYSVGTNSAYPVNAGVSMRGIRLVKTSSGSANERLTCDMYTAI
jgi:hypothetical protein